jgi:hypothetical protein
MQLSARLLGSFGMSTFFKLVLLTILVVLIAHLWPIVTLPFALIALAMLLLGGVTAGGVAIVFVVGLILVAAVLAIILSLTAALSPIWIPVAIVLAVMAIFKRKSGVTL